MVLLVEVFYRLFLFLAIGAKVQECNEIPGTIVDMGKGFVIYCLMGDDVHEEVLFH